MTPDEVPASEQKSDAARHESAQLPNRDSMLDGASSPEALVGRAVELGYPALALTDHNGLYGAVRFWQADSLERMSHRLRSWRPIRKCLP